MTCDHQGRDGRQARFCEIREQAIPSTGKVNIEGGPNGGISVRGWNRGDVWVRGQVQSSAATEAEAKSFVSLLS